jgi:6-phosphogluconolactonase
MRDQVHVCDDSEALAAHARDWLIKQIDYHLRTFDTPFSLALSGGSTPKRLYQLLSRDPDLNIDWSRVLLVWGDERNVPPDDPQSNYRMVKENLLDHIDIPEENVLAVPEPGGDPAVAAASYERLLRERLYPRQRLPEEFASGFQLPDEQPSANNGSQGADPVSEWQEMPFINCVLLGLGDDVHTASLFPGTPALMESERTVVENFVPQLDCWRITLTVPMINTAEHIAFLISGESKLAALTSLWHAPVNPAQFPAQLIHPSDGNLWFFLDKAAMGDIPLPESVMVQLI